MKLKHLTSPILRKAGPRKGEPVAFVVCEHCLVAHGLEEKGDVIRDATVADGREFYGAPCPPSCSYCGEEDPALTQAWVQGRAA